MVQARADFAQNQQLSIREAAIREAVVKEAMLERRLLGRRLFERRLLERRLCVVVEQRQAVDDTAEACH